MKVKLLMLLVYAWGVTHQSVYAMQQVPGKEITLIASDGKSFTINKNTIYKFSPVIKELTELTGTNILTFNEVHSSVLEYILALVQYIAPMERVLCQDRLNELHFFPFKMVKQAGKKANQKLSSYEALYFAHQEGSKKRKFAEEENFLGEALRATSFLEMPVISNYLAFIAAEKLSHKIAINHVNLTEKMLLQEGFGYQNENIKKLINKHLTIDKTDLKRYKLIEEYTIADYLLEHGQPPIVEGTLSLYDKNITSLYGLSCIDKINYVVILDLYSNKIIELSPDVFSSCVSLRKLNLESNYIKIISPVAFNGLSQLVNLTLENNLISEIPSYIFKDLTKLESLYLKGNNIEALSKDLFVGLSQLKTLSLGRNKINIIHYGAFDDLPELWFLELFSNSISYLPEKIFNNLSNLEELLLGDNQLSYLPTQIFSKLKNLKMISLAANSLYTLPRLLFAASPDLSRVYLSKNLLTQLPNELFSSDITGIVIDLEDNKLIHISEQFFSHLILVPEKLINLRNNPLDNQTKALINEFNLHFGYNIKYSKKI